MNPRDPLKKVLYIDLTKRKYWVEEREDLFSKYLGGVGVGIKLLEENCPPEIDPLSPENSIILAIGPLNGLFPLASKTVALFKSPHTGNLGESHAGGRSGLALRMAGYGAIVVKGKSERPCYIAIHSNKVFFRDATTLWGLKAGISAARLIRAKEPGAGLRTIIRIGPAGEKLITYSSVTLETYRHFGRLGLGAVFGSKNLKAIVISGQRDFPVSDFKTYKEVYKELMEEITGSPKMKKYHELGTPANVLPLSLVKGLPIKNLTTHELEKVEEISGEAFAEKYLARRVACTHCPVACIHLAAIREPYEDEPYFYKTTYVSYDYELIYALGSMLGISDSYKVLKLIQTVEDYGLDAISTGVILAWCTEAFEKGLIKETQTEGLVPRWGEAEVYMEMIKKIVESSKEFYQDLGKGLHFVVEKYGGEDFALVFGKNEMAGYHTGIAGYAGFLLGARHSHLDNAGYSLDQACWKNNLSLEEMAEKLLKEELWRQILSSLVICFFAREIYRLDKVLKCLSIAGYDLNEEKIWALAEKIYAHKYNFKIKSGFDMENLKVPKRIFELSTFTGEIKPENLEVLLKLLKEKIRNLLEAQAREPLL